MEKKRSVGITVVGWTEITMGLVILYFSISLIMAREATWGFGVYPGVFFGSISIFLIISGKLTLRLRSLGRKLNIILFWILVVLCLETIFISPIMTLDIGKFSINVIPVVFMPLVLLLAYVSFHPKAKEQFKNNK